MAKNIKSFEEHNKAESFSFTKEEKDYLWSKLEFTKRKKAESDKNELYKLLKVSNKKMDISNVLEILNALEYSFKNRLKDIENPINSESFKSIQSKIPEEWIGVKFSSISAKVKRDEREKDNKTKKP